MKRVGNFVVLTGSEVSDDGRGKASTIVILSRGSVASSDEGSSAGEQARMRCRRCVFDV